MKEKHTKTDKGVAGLTILLSLVTMLFVIGLLVMIFSLMGGELQDATYTDTLKTVTNETGGYVNSTGYQLGDAELNIGSFVITQVVNATDGDGTPLTTGNYSVSSTGLLTNATVNTWPSVNVTYTYHYDASNTATDVMNDTTSSVGTVTDWFPIFIVIGAMIVLILLTVIIITAIRGSGLMSDESA